MPRLKLSIIIPALNEECTISSVIQEVPHINKMIAEVVVIDDGSSDRTAIEALKMGVTVLSNKKNEGLGMAFKKGLEYAYINGASLFAIIDADGQYNPRNLTAFSQHLLRDNVDMVLGNRFMIRKHYEENYLKKATNYFISFLISVILLHKKEVYDIQSSFKMFNRKVAKFALFNLLGSYNYVQEMSILILSSHFKTAQFPIECKKRVLGKSHLIKNPISHLFKIFIMVIKTYIRITVKNYFANQVS
jgi:glycosyltransferase involved in cell wall biosynthesis